jgi:hypothetical protein
MTANAAHAPAEIHEAMTAISSRDKEAQGTAFQFLMRETEQPVSWSYVIWDDLITALSHKDNRTRAIAGQLLCNLAKSDPDARFERDLDKIFAVTFDERFVTARHVLLALWKAGVHNLNVRTALVRKLVERFASCVDEKNWTLVRYDILSVLRTLYDHTDDEDVRKVAIALIPLETDVKYSKKYATVWRGL